MNRMVYVVLFLGTVAGSGCSAKRIEAARQRAEAAALEVSKLQTEKIRPLEETVESLHTQFRTGESQRGSAEKKLESLRKNLVTSWGGDPAVLKGMVEKAAVPKEMVSWLELAQKSVGQEAFEQQLLNALKSKNKESVAKLVAYWEVAAGVDVDPSSPEDTSTQCPDDLEEVACEPFSQPQQGRGSVWLCHEKKWEQWWFMSTRSGELSAHPLPATEPTRMKMVKALTPDFMVLESEPVTTGKDDKKGEVSKRWLSVVQLMGDQATVRVQWAVAVKPQEGSTDPRVVYVDLDKDGVEEAVWSGGNRLAGFRADRAKHEGVTWSDQEVCAVLDKMGSTAPKELAKTCKTVAVPDGGDTPRKP